MNKVVLIRGLGCTRIAQTHWIPRQRFSNYDSETKMASAEMPSKIKLIYFDMRARGEAIRINLVYAGIPFEDVRLDYDMENPQSDWMKMKPTTPWGTLPILEVDGQVVGQSQTISRFVAKLTGTHGDDIYEQAKYDGVVDACQDLSEDLVLWILEEDEKVKEKKRKELEQKLELLTKQLEKILGSDDFFGGSKLSWADLQFFSLMENLKPSGLSKYFESSKPLSVLLTRIQEIPSIKTYLAKRKWTEF